MTEQNSYNPYETFKKLGSHWEKHMNELVHLWTDNQEFLRASNVSADVQARYMEWIQTTQEMMANQLNLPTKKDVANVSKIAIQAEEKLDALEEQLWKISDSVNDRQNEISEVVDVSQEVIKLTKRLRTDLNRMKKEVAATKDLQEEVKELREEVANVGDIKKELEEIKGLLYENQRTKNEEVVTNKEEIEEKDLIESGNLK